MQRVSCFLQVLPPLKKYYIYALEKKHHPSLKHGFEITLKLHVLRCLQLHPPPPFLFLGTLGERMAERTGRGALGSVLHLDVTPETNCICGHSSPGIQLSTWSSLLSNPRDSQAPASPVTCLICFVQVSLKGIILREAKDPIACTQWSQREKVELRIKKNTKIRDECHLSFQKVEFAWVTMTHSCHSDESGC